MDDHEKMMALKEQREKLEAEAARLEKEAEITAKRLEAAKREHEEDHQRYLIAKAKLDHIKNE